MEKNISYNFLLLISIYLYGITSFFYGCKEVGPDIDLTPPVNDTTLIDTSYIDPNPIIIQPRNVLIEEFTGVQCTNCSQGHEKLKNIMLKNNGRIIAVSIHDGFYSEPIKGKSKQDFRTKGGTDIVTMLGSPQGWPSACVSRIKFNGEPERNLPLNKWENYSNDLLKENAQVNLTLNSVYTSIDRSFKINIKLHYAKADTGSQAISVVILENKIIDAQITDVKIDTAYEHNLVFRTLMTPTAGDKIIYPKEAGRVVIKEFKIKLSVAWKAENCEAVVFVHKTGTTLDVLNVQKINVTQ